MQQPEVAADPATAGPEGPPRVRRPRGAASATRESILRAATGVFARHGYDGGSVEKISREAKSVDRMIYYYFGSKEGLFIEVLEGIYARMNEAESELLIDVERPREALEAVIRFLMGYYRRHPEFVTLLNTENLHKGRHIAKSLKAREYSSPTILLVSEVLQSGERKEVFRKGIAARDLYLLIAAAGYFYMSNRHTLSAFLGEDLLAPDSVEHWERFVIDTVLRAVAP
ncbi:MAG: TetR/AcrR family transcriptional regulator [Burkholderiales bacterium]